MFPRVTPYSPQVISAAGVAGISPFLLVPYSIYPILLGICGLVAIILRVPRLKDKPQNKYKLKGSYSFRF